MVIKNSVVQAIDDISVDLPNKVAIEWHNQKRTFFQIHNRSLCIADFLIRNISGSRNIAVLMDRKPLLIEFILGILRVGGVFIPLDSRMPENRLKVMMDETRTSWVISERKYLGLLNSIAQSGNSIIKVIIEGSEEAVCDSYPYLSINTFYIDETKEEIHIPDVFCEDCYIYFTSGSTGKPKGVLGRNSSLKHFIDWEISCLNIDKNDRVSQLTNPTFDPFLRDIFVPLCSGATVCIPEEQDIVLYPRKLTDWIELNDISLIHMVPTLFKNMVRELNGSESFKSLRYIALAGELLKGRDLEKFYELFGTRIQLVNLYGPTETTLAKVYYMININDTERVNIPVGKPIYDTEVFILDEHMKVCQQGCVGEIYISTPYMSSGYINDNDLNNKVFLKNFQKKLNYETIYKTGDLGRLLADGNIECLGRIDNQIKIRGMRVELSEIEAHILKSKVAKEAVVIAKEDKDGEKYICAFLTGDVVINELRRKIEKTLPDYMIPSRFAVIEAFPLLNNGKVDRKALLNYEFKDDFASSYQAPCNEIEEKLVALWEKVLCVKKAGVNDNFFFLGGHSLKAARLVTAIQKELNINVAIKDVFRNNTVKALAEYISGSEESICDLIPECVERETYPVSSAQKRIFLVSLIENIGTAYNMPEIMVLEGKLDMDLFENSFKEIVQRHDSLRTTFEYTEAGLVQRIHKEVDFKIEYFDIENQYKYESDIKAAIKDFAADFVRPFDLGQALLIRLRLVKLNEDKYIFLRDMHHIISDGISEEIIKAELKALYNGSELKPLRVQYKDFSEWQNVLLNSEKIKRQEKYWMDMFSGELPVLDIPSDYVRPSVQSFEGDSIIIGLESELIKRIKDMALDNGATMYMLFLTAFYVLLSKYTGQEDIIVGSPVAGRNHADLDGLVGVFINTLAIRNCFSLQMTFRQFLEVVKDKVLEAFENQEYPFEDLIDKLGIDRDLSRNPLFNVMFIMQNMHFEDLDMNGIRAIPHALDKNVSKLDITLGAILKNESVELNFEYCTRLFKKETIEAMSRHYLNILGQITENADIKLCEIDILSFDERNQILNEFNNTCMPYMADKTIHELFEERVKTIPDKEALIFGDHKFTYGELNEKSNRLAFTLREKGIRADSIVGLMVSRSFEMIVGIMGILKAGGAYLPIDPQYPLERVRYMLENSKCGLVLIDHTINMGGVTAECISLSDSGTYSENCKNLQSITKSHHMAYVIYTSGSTGKPKGVMIDHRNVINFITGMTAGIAFIQDKTILNLTTLSFDIFVLETLLPLVKGLTVVIADEQQQLDPDLLGGLIKSKRIDILQITPSRLQMLLKFGKGLVYLENISELLVGGEAFPESLLRELASLENTRIYNVYGPTETTVWSTIKELTGQDRINIGRPIANTRIYILDKNNSLLHVGGIGELYIAGDGLARGYFAMDDLSRERFVPDPFSDGQRMYRTGDLARWLPDGEIEYMGRVDHQVKIRGYRIELSEVENCLMTYKDVENCVCTVDEDIHGIKLLAAYYVSGNDISVNEVRTYMARHLPDYMVPQVYKRIEEIPTTPNGKVDRIALKNSVGFCTEQQEEYTQAKTRTEERIYEIWSEVLGQQRIGTNSSFFDLGGNSLLLVFMHKRIERLFPGKVKIPDIFANPTIARLSRFIDDSGFEVNKKDIMGIKVKEEFLVSGDELDEETVFEYEIKNGLMNGLRNVSQAGNARVGDILLVLYIYLLSELTVSTDITIQNVVDAGRCVQLGIDLLGIKDMESLFEAVCMKKQAIKSEDIYYVKALNLSDYLRDKDSVVAVFADNVDIDSGIFGKHGFVLKACETYDAIKLTLECPCSVIRCDKAEVFFNWYVRLINKMVTEA